MESASAEGDYHQSLFLYFVAGFEAVTLIYPLVVFLLLVLSALISGSEVAFFSLSAEQLKKLGKEPNGAEANIVRLLEKPRYLLSTILIANNLVNVGIIITGYYFFNAILSETTSIWVEFLINVVGITFILVLFGEVIPKIYANTYNLRTAKLMSYPLLFLVKVFRPVSFLLVQSTLFIEKNVSIKNDSGTSIEELDHAIDLTVNNDPSGQEARILKGIVKFGTIEVSEIMRARVDIEAIEEAANFTELKNLIFNCGYSRIPVYRENIDAIIGILYIKDLLPFLSEGPDFDWKKLIRQPYYVPETKKIDDLLKEIQVNRKHMAIVVDEYGGTSGLATLEDILEEVIGEIQDEYDEGEEIPFEKIRENVFEFEGKTLINDVCKAINLEKTIFDEIRGEADSLGGLILELNGNMPKDGEVISFQNFEFCVLEVGENRIKKVRITIGKTTDNEVED